MPSPLNPPRPSLPLADAAGPRLDTLALTNGARQCTGDQAWCLLTAEGQVRINGAARAAFAEGDDIWPAVIRMRRGASEDAIFGIVHTESQSYSGGGAHAAALSLYLASAPPDASPLATLPIEGHASIRACFSEQDVRERREACADEYDFVADLSLDQDNKNVWPVLILTSEASTFPGRRSRNEDSTTMPPLGARDLVRWRDPDCSYVRRFHFDPGTAIYVADAALPLCSDYLEP